MQLKTAAIVALAVLLAAPATATPLAPSHDDDPGLGWKIGVGCALATIALSGVVGAVAHEPLEKLVRPLGPAASAALTPSAIAAVTAGVGAAVGVTLVMAAEGGP